MYDLKKNILAQQNHKKKLYLCFFDNGSLSDFLFLIIYDITPLLFTY